jgi:predicted GTPase
MGKGKEAKPYIEIFSRRHVGKSSIINVLVKQDVAIVSDMAVTTTDPVKKSLEIPEIAYRSKSLIGDLVKYIDQFAAY